MDTPRAYRRVKLDEWIITAAEQRAASRTIVATFLVCFLGVLTAGAVALAGASTADLDYEGLEGGARASCLRATRRADYTVVYLNLGSPVQRLQLLLDLGSPVHPGEPSLRLFSERMHKSLTMECGPLDPPLAYTQACEDVAMLQVNSSGRQSLTRASFLYQNDRVERGLGNNAATLGLDGVLAPVAGRTYWLTTSHLCFAPFDPWSATSDEALPFDENMSTSVSDLRAFGPLRDSPVARASEGACNASLSSGAPIRLFPSAAANEADTWLSLSERFLYEYGSDVLDKRRQVVELGADCSARSPELAHVARMYGADCGLALRPCQTEPAVPYRRLATSRVRVDYVPSGGGVLRAEPTLALGRIAGLADYTEALSWAIARLFVLLLTAAVVFVRGSQNAASSRYMLQHTIDVLRCRKQFAKPSTPLGLIGAHTNTEVAVDAAISVAALAARVLVLAFSWDALTADGNQMALIAELAGTALSVVHLALRYVLDWDLNVEAPLTKLGGPMSVVDVTTAVLILFSDAPLLTSDDRKFAAIGRLLISVLISIAVLTRCCFAAAMVATMAVAARNGKRRELHAHQLVLVSASIIWGVQAVLVAACTALLFARPVAVSMTRSQPGNVDVWKYAVWLGLLAAALPTYTKVSLRFAQLERAACTKQE
jgi:hypothetical protein